jgi:uncharacterized protein
MTTLAAVLAGSADLYVPAFEVLIGNKKLGREVVHDVLDVSFHDSLDELGGFSLTLANWDAEKYTFAYSDTDLFDPGKNLDLRMGYLGAGRMSWMIRGVITDLTPSFPASGPPTLQVSGRNRLHDLLRQRQSKVHAESNLSLVRRIVGAAPDLRLDPHIASLAVDLSLDAVVQENEFDLIFLKRRARQLGYDLIVAEDDRGTVLRLVNSALRKDDALRLAYRGARGAGPLIDFQPRFSTARQPESLELHSWNARDKQPIKVRIGRTQLSLRDPPFDRNAIATAVRGRTEIISAEPVQDEAEGRRRAVDYLERIVKETMTATGRTVGLPELRAGTALEISGVGNRFNGRWLTTSTDHSIGSGGYVTSFACRREER